MATLLVLRIKFRISQGLIYVSSSLVTTTEGRISTPRPTVGTTPVELTTSFEIEPTTGQSVTVTQTSPVGTTTGKS